MHAVHASVRIQRFIGEPLRAIGMGGQCRYRTYEQELKSLLLYQLS
jgi:hypothetical protein